MPKYKTQTNDLTEVIEAGGGAGLEVIEITGVDETATSGTLNEAQMAIVNSDTPSCVKFNNEYYYKNDDNHTDGITVYTHTGYTETDGGSTIKYFSITLATSAWTLTTQNVSGKLYTHILRFYPIGTSELYKDPETNNVVLTDVYLYFICSSPTALNSWDDYYNLISSSLNIDYNCILNCVGFNQYTYDSTVVLYNLRTLVKKANATTNYLKCEFAYYQIGDAKIKSGNVNLKDFSVRMSVADILPIV